MSQPRARGRPRSPQTEEAILTAALDQFLEAGLEGLAIERVAELAGVSRTTIYLRWPDRLALAKATIGRALPAVTMPEQTGEPRQDLRSYLHALIASMQGQNGALTAMVVAESVRSRTFRSAMRGAYLRAGHEQRMAELICRIDRPGFHWTTENASMAAEALIGLIAGRVLSGDRAIDSGFVDQAIAVVVGECPLPKTPPTG